MKKKIYLCMLLALGAGALKLKAQNEHANLVTICHKGHEINVAQEAVQAHLDHGDWVGSCNTNITGTMTAGPGIVQNEKTHTGKKDLLPITTTEPSNNRSESSPAKKEEPVLKVSDQAIKD